MNAKLEDVKNAFNEKMLDLYKTNQVLDHQIRIFERIEETGNIGIKLSEMNCEDIVVKLQIVENDPTTIWKCIQKYFGYGFFNVMIEKEFGINPYTHEEIVHNFIGQVTGVKENALEKLRRIEDVTEQRYKEIKLKFEDYESYIQIIEARHTQEVKILKANLDDLLNETTERIKINFFKKYDVEKQELFEIIRSLKVQLARSRGEEPDTDSIAHHVSMFEQGVSGLSFIDNPEDEKDLMLNKIQNELHMVTREHHDAVFELENFRFLTLKAEKDREFLIRQSNNWKNDYLSMKERFYEYKSTNKDAEKDIMFLQKANQISKTLIESLEEEVDTLRGQFKLLEGMIPKEKLESFERQNPFPLLKRRNQTSNHTIDNKSVSLIKKMYRDTFKSKDCQTEICGTKRKLTYEDEEFEGIKIPTFSIACQTTLFKHVQSEMQTDLTSQDISNLESKLENNENAKEEVDTKNDEFLKEIEELKKIIAKKDHEIEKLRNNTYTDENSLESISEDEHKENTFITDSKRPKTQPKSKKPKSKSSKATRKGKKTVSIDKSSESRSRLNSRDHSLSKSKKSSQKIQYVYCKDCKRRRIQRRTIHANTGEKETEPEEPQKTNKLLQSKFKHKMSSNKLPRSQSTVLMHHISKIDEDAEESDFKVNESVYSKISLDSVYTWEYDEYVDDHFDFELNHFRSKPYSLINEIFNKLDIYEKIKLESNQKDINKLTMYLQSKVSKMQREYLELLFLMIFENISKKDEITEIILKMIAKEATENKVSKKVYKTIIQPKFEVIPYNIRNIENILNKVYSLNKSDRGGNIHAKMGHSVPFIQMISTETQTESSEPTAQRYGTFSSSELMNKLSMSIFNNKEINKEKKSSRRAKIANLKQRITESSSGIFNSKMEDYMLMNKSSHTLYPNMEDFKNRIKVEDGRNMFSQSMLTKHQDARFLPAVDLSSSGNLHDFEVNKQSEFSHLSSLKENFMMTGHKFSSTYSNQNDQSPLPEMPYNSSHGVEKVTKVRAKHRDNENSNERNLAKSINEISIKDNSIRSNSFKRTATDGRVQEDVYGKTSALLRSRNHQMQGHSYKLNTSSWLFSKRTSSMKETMNSASRQRKIKNISQIANKRSQSKTHS